jgi:hypothetical protein
MTREREETTMQRRKETKMHDRSSDARDASPRRAYATPSRRHLLNALGLGAGTLFLPSLLGKRAAAAGPHVRFLVFYTNQGPGYENWMMRRPGLPTEKSRDWEFPLDDPDPSTWSQILAPLHPHRKDLLVLDGLARTSALADRFTNQHNMGAAHALAPYPTKSGGFNNDGRGGGVSLDQFIAKQVAVAGRIPSLFVGSGNAAFTPVIDFNTTEMAPQGNPAQVFERLFPSGAADPGRSQPMPGLDAARVRRRSVLDLVRREYDRVLPRVGREDRNKLAQHQALVGDLEKQIAAIGTVQCAAPKRAFPNRGGTWDRVDANASFMKLVASAMACDLTRVAVIRHDELPAAAFGASGHVHNDIAHKAWAGTPQAKMMADYYAVHAKQFAELISLFKSVPEGSGTMLDNTIMLWTSEIGHGKHHLHLQLSVLAGRGGGAFTTGRYVKYGEIDPNPAPHNGDFDQWWGKGTLLGPAHSKLLVSIMNAMGVPGNSFGSTTSAVGGDYGGKGMKIDLTGPLPRLRVG